MLGLDQAPGTLTSSGAALSPRRATYCSFASPKESRQRKGEPKSRPLRFASGFLALLASGGVELELATLHFAQTIARPDPPAAPLLSPATRRGDGVGSEGEYGFGSGHF